jgi:VanZ like family
VRQLVATLRLHWFSLSWLTVILLVTLVPLTAPEARPSPLCALCGVAAVADSALNAALFLPLGAALSMTGWHRGGALVLGASLSLGVELFQLVIPGRDPSPADFLSNTIGTLLGITLVQAAPAWWRPGRRLAHALSISGAIGATSAVLMTGVLLHPSFPEETYYGGRTPHFDHLEWYGGRLLAASLDGLEVPAGVVARSAEARQRLLSGATLHVHAHAGPPPPGLAPLLTIHDRRQHEILLVGVDGDDLVYRYRTRAIAWRLGGSEIRIGGALRGVAAGDPLSVVVRRTPPGYCVRVNATEYCGLGYTLGSGWVFLLSGQPLTMGLRSVLNVLWAAALLFPAGLWSRRGPLVVVVAALLAGGLLILPPLVGLLPTPRAELLGALVGFLAGTAVARSALRLRTRATGSADDRPCE